MLFGAGGREIHRIKQQDNLLFAAKAGEFYRRFVLVHQLKIRRGVTRLQWASLCHLGSLKDALEFNVVYTDRVAATPVANMGGKYVDRNTGCRCIGRSTSWRPDWRRDRRCRRRDRMAREA